WLSERLGQQFVIENRPGASGNIATEAVVRAPPDGYTLLVTPSSAAINATLYNKLSFNFIHDIAPVAGVFRGPYVMVVNPSVPTTTVPELIAYAKANPRKLNMASPGTGTGPHIAGELFKMMAGVDMVHVPYRGAGPSLTNLIGGQVQVTFESTPASIGYIRAGTLRALAVTTTRRSEALPDIPTVAEFVPGYEASTWYGVCAPKATPAEIVDKLNKEINAGLADPKLKARLADLGGDALALSPADFGKLIADENREMGQRHPDTQHQGGVRPIRCRYSIKPVELSRCRGIEDRCKVGSSAGMITVRRDAVKTQGRAPKGGGDQRDHEAVGSSSQLEARFQSRRGCQMRHFCHS